MWLSPILANPHEPVDPICVAEKNSEQGLGRLFMPLRIKPEMTWFEPYMYYLSDAAK